MMKKLTATIGVSVALGVAGVVAAPSASAHWGDYCQYDLLGRYGVRVMCPAKTTPGSQFTYLAYCANGTRKSTRMTLQGNWASVTCYPSRLTGGRIYYR